MTGKRVPRRHASSSVSGCRKGGTHPAKDLFTLHGRDDMTYQKPSVQRFGSLRELTLGGGSTLQGDATNLYHRS
ncbi:MAG: hypothetical protein DMD35_18005 [Gemmatimonadetes bacterium]|nr:MAG: hypothetical protein DMD35_18005 [Gemmatimonadota bacterium]